MSVFTNPASASAEQAEAYTRALLDLLGDADPLEVLRDTPGRLRMAVGGLSETELSRREKPGKWAVRHVVRHLADSEIVWGWRLRLTLAHDRPKLTGYDQDAWADRLQYDDAVVAWSLDEFDVLRRSNLWLLQHASPADLDRVALHDERGEESLRHMLGLYAGHDLLHLRQIDRIRGG
jgi:hypothetical protein